MAEKFVPHFHNTPGVPVIEIGAREFMCVGELPPLDHPHVFLDMGDAVEIRPLAASASSGITSW